MDTHPRLHINRRKHPAKSTEDEHGLKPRREERLHQCPILTRLLKGRQTQLLTVLSPINASLLGTLQTTAQEKTLQKNKINL